jgi:two-component system LytT family sensor kinase
MNGVSAVAGGLVVNLVGFLTGAVLYAMLVALVWREHASDGTPLIAGTARLPLFTGLAGLLWNVGGLVTYGLAGFSGQPAPLWINVVAFSALGALPAFIVHSLFGGQERIADRRTTVAVTWLAYGVSGVAAALHVWAAVTGIPVPAPAAVWVLTTGFSALTVLLLLMTRGNRVRRRSVWVAALATFVLTAFHFNQHGGGQNWWVELLGHHASLPLALAILHQDYRFAFADLFLKNALAWLAMMGLSAALFSAALVPLVNWRDVTGAVDPRAVALAVGLWAATALAFPAIRRAASLLVDRTMLRRPDYEDTMTALGRTLDGTSSEADAIGALGRALDQALGVTEVRPQSDPVPASDLRLVIAGPSSRAYVSGGVALLRPDTVDPPRIALVIGALRDGRRLLSDDLRLLEGATRLLARRLDVQRVTEERLAQSVREQQMQQLATEAELRALRAQINPHFLFNALTTIGYLIQTTPAKALDTLLKLTGVLRAVLRQSHADFVTLGDELALVQSYLDIEAARFEERLTVHYDIDATATHLMMPSFTLQPLVENAVKHGIAPLGAGGAVTVRARRDDTRLVLEVRDTGAGFDPAAARLSSSVGLTNVERRLAALYGARATLVIVSAPGNGCRVEMQLPLTKESHVHR